MTRKTIEEYGSEGGKKTLEKYGKNHFSKLAKKRWQKEKRNRSLQGSEKDRGGKQK